jgi:hypothetical protein
MLQNDPCISSSKMLYCTDDTAFGIQHNLFANDLEASRKTSILWMLSNFRLGNRLSLSYQGAF